MISAVKSSACGRFIHSFNRSSSVSFRRLHFTISSLFHFVHSTSLSTPRQKPRPCSTPQIQPFGFPVFGNLPSIQLYPVIKFKYHKHIKILHFQKTGKLLKALHDILRNLFSLALSWHFPYPIPQILQCFLFPAISPTPVFL